MVFGWERLNKQEPAEMASWRAWQSSEDHISGVILVGMVTFDWLNYNKLLAQAQVPTTQSGLFLSGLRAGQI